MVGPRGWLQAQSPKTPRTRPSDTGLDYMAAQMQQRQHSQHHSPNPTFFTYSMYEGESSMAPAQPRLDAGGGTERQQPGGGEAGRGSRARNYYANATTPSASGGASLHQQMQQQMDLHREEKRSKSTSRSQSRSREQPRSSEESRSQSQSQSQSRSSHSRSVERGRSSSRSRAHAHAHGHADNTSTSRAAYGASAYDLRRSYNHHHPTHHQSEAYIDNTFGGSGFSRTSSSGRYSKQSSHGSSHKYSTYGGVSTTPSQISGYHTHVHKTRGGGGTSGRSKSREPSSRSRSSEPIRSRSTHSRSGGSQSRSQSRGRSRSRQQRQYVDPYAAVAREGSGSRSRSRSRSPSLSSRSSRSSRSSASDDSSRTEEEVGKKLVVQYTLERDPSSNDGSNQYRDAYGAPTIKDEVKVKARVENSILSLVECLDIKREEEERIEKMDRVGRKMHQRASEKQIKTHSLFVTTPFNSTVDASDAIGVVSSYITAYRALHRTTSRTIHKHDRVLVTKAQGALGRAVVELATSAGAGQVFGICPAKYHSRVARWGATALDEEEFMTWSDGLLGAVDVVIDIDGTTNGDISSAAALTANQTSGKLVRVFTTGPDGVTLAESSTRQPKSPFARSRSGKSKDLRRDAPHTANYDVFNDIEEDPQGFLSDLQLLFDMVNQGYVRPKKKKAIPLEGMEYIEVKFQRPPLRYSPIDRNSSSSRGRGRFADDEKSARSGRSRSSRGRSPTRRHSDARDDDCDTRSIRSGRSGYRDEREGGRGRSRSRSRSIFRSRSKSRDAGDRSRDGGSDDWETQSARSGYSACSARSKSSTRSVSSKAGSIIKRSLSMGSLRRKGSKGGENDQSSANGSLEVDPWKPGYDYVQKKEHGNEYSSHLLMRDMSTQSFLLALGKNPEAAR